ncbi:selT/selW/selH selenoprotein domain-containing protein [Colletotrichum tofieldiae]|uniref:SelT/selW/selH selenoprotein domain-containing protein n=1 Tax=Colletotrichum tofieldiae TaxID=708197 RepID=A0A161YF01_9PEZI|nr:selT/selW/selH selenoprotein domain-containing protein [Colletotrichum tofieldiae]GKT53428.1 selT/selW/selH selenoprotein domain-containing protein [Colletotrichum tofieldiae]GKT73185.1 selT/selW/selH selenoprotein domain-containing protein [Colletotrichum tofieldiae]GKT88155.1 selT/selW/selH selenoprotein domain-containing protein [Colletotrichum tofieldiae]
MAEAAPTVQPTSAPTPTLLPRVAIQFCTQCKWMLRAAYFAQELLSTFSTSIGEVALQPSTGGTFTVTLTHLPAGAETTSTTILWDRKTEGGFPETKELKRRLRDVIQPDRDLGHVDRKHAKPTTDTTTTTTAATSDTQASDAVATAPTMAPPSTSASDVVSQLKKHPANANKTPAGESAPTAPANATAGGEAQSTLGDAARDAIGAARANTGQKAKAEISPAGQLPGQQYDDPPAKFNKEKCEDCA